MAPRTKAAEAAGPSFADLDDAALGIGEDDAPAADMAGVDMAALMAHPDFAKAIDAIVEARLRLVGAPPPSRSGSEAAFDAFLSKFDHMLEVQAEQKPGYIKPLSADEVDARAKGKADMFGLLRRFKAESIWPHYLLGTDFAGPSPNGPMLYEAGSEINTRLPPGDSWTPMNDAAIQVYAAYKRWIGEVVPVDELIAQAAQAARGVSNVPEVEAQRATAESEVMLVDAPKRDMAPKRVLGTITPELAGKPMPSQPGMVQQPVGPIFVGDAA